MVLKITDSCDMGCSHCLSDCKPTNNFMSWETLKIVDAFISIIDPLCLIISGGEPLMHPEFEAILNYIYGEFSCLAITIATNGEWLLAHKDDAIRMYERYPHVMWQISNDSRFYPRKIDLKNDLWKNRDRYILTINDDCVQKVYPLGRAEKNGLGEEFKCSQCFNIRSATYQMGDFQKAVKALEARGKFCTPSITWDGYLDLGESNLCKPLGKVEYYMSTFFDKNTTSMFSEITKDTINFTCKKCQWINEKLPALHKTTINFE